MMMELPPITKLVQLKALHEQSFRLLSSTLEFDERIHFEKRKPQSEELEKLLAGYKQGTQLLLDALQCPLTNFPPSERPEVSVLMVKMQQTFQGVKSRMDSLTNHVVASSLVTPTSDSVSPTTSNSKSSTDDTTGGFLSFLTSYLPTSLTFSSTSDPPNPPLTSSIQGSSIHPPTIEGNRSITRATTSALSSSSSQRVSKPPTTAPTSSLKGNSSPSTTNAAPSKSPIEPYLEEIKRFPTEIREAILNEILVKSPGVQWDAIAGLKEVKQRLMESIILPSRRPDIFCGLRLPTKGVLLYGPPGTGKTMLAKAVATEAKCTFFSITSATLVSRYLGDSEKLVRCLFCVARAMQPSLIFIDEADGLLSKRSQNEHEASRRLKTEFLIQFDGLHRGEESQVMVLAATNRPDDLDDAMRRRFTQRIYIPLPEKETRILIVQSLLANQRHSLTSKELDRLGDLTSGYSGSDMKALCHEAAMQPVREVKDIDSIREDQIRPISLADFTFSLQKVRPSVPANTIRMFEDFTNDFGFAS